MESDLDPGSLLESAPDSCMLAGSESVSDSLIEGFSCGRVSRANCLALQACRRTLAFLLRVKPAEGELWWAKGSASCRVKVVHHVVKRYPEPHG